MGKYLFLILCTLASAAMLIWRPFPGMAIIVVAVVILLASVALTLIGEREGVDDMGWRYGLAILAPFLIGISTAV